jgi:hypothetical protein
MSMVVPSQIRDFLNQTFSSSDDLITYNIANKMGAVAGFLDLYDRLPSERNCSPRVDEWFRG